MATMGSAGSAAEEKLRKQHTEIDDLMKALDAQLNALTNFHFTPKPQQEELKVISNAPSIQVEEIIPAAVSDATRLAPEEVYEVS